MIDVRSASDLAEPLALLERWLRDDDPVPESFARRLCQEVEAGRLEFLVARTRGRTAGVAVLAYRLNISAAGLFASVENLYVVPDARRRGVGTALLEAVAGHCAARDISYIEAQVDSEEAEAFYMALGYEPEPGIRVFSRSFPL